ncbi:unnamed protein product [Scytosiphon promiscuus]
MQGQVDGAASPALAVEGRSLRLQIGRGEAQSPPTPVGTSPPLLRPGRVSEPCPPLLHDGSVSARFKSLARARQGGPDEGLVSPGDAVRAPDMRRKRDAGHSGLQSGTGAGTSRSGRRRAKKRVRARMSSTVGLGLPDVSERLAGEEHRQQQRQARENGKRRREHELAEHDRERVERSRASNRRHSDGQMPAGVSGRRRSSGGRRESAPGRRGSMSRRKECGRDTCGWRPSGTGTVCTLCSGVVVHDEDDRLCSACRRTLNDVGVTHLGKVRLASAQQQLATEARAEASPMPASVLDTLQPTSDCLCKRTDCFATFLKSKERNAVKFCGRRCVGYSRAGPGIQWYRGGETAGAS